MERRKNTIQLQNTNNFRIKKTLAYIIHTRTTYTNQEGKTLIKKERENKQQQQQHKNTIHNKISRKNNAEYRTSNN